MIRRLHSLLPWVWWRDFIWFWGPAIAGNDELSSDRITARAGRR